MTVETQLVKLVASRNDPGGYEILVFQIINENEYIMCTKLPNWNSKTPSLNELGYLQIREFIAGEDKWYDFTSGELIPYKYTGIYFWDFVKYEEKDKEEYVID